MIDSKKCNICDNPTHPLAKYCKRCKKLIDRVDMRRKVDKNARVEALKMAWDGEYFRCYYSGIPLVEKDHKDPRYITFDHRVPRRESDIVISAAAINDMKSDLNEDEFKAVVIQLANRFKGGKFDQTVFNFRHWKR